jgi:glycosyltransferase involved in cell wall biosynthesis
MQNFLKFSIVTVVLNREKYIKDSIENVISQDYANFEHIVIDGGSSDGTLEVLNSYPHLQWISEPDEGSVFALNKGLKRIKGDIFGWLNSDELYAPNLFNEVNNLFNQYPEIDMVYGTTEFISPTGEVIGKTRFKKFTVNRELLGLMAICAPSSVFVRISALDKIGRYVDERWKDTYDHDLWIRIGKKCKVLGINKCFSKFTFHSGSGVAGTPEKAIKEAKKLRISHGRDINLINRLFLVPMANIYLFLYRKLKLNKIIKKASF